MQFEWDEVKNRSNIRKHGIDFTDAIAIFKHTVLTAADGREDSRRGSLDCSRMDAVDRSRSVVLYVEHRGDTIRIISARKATRAEIKRYGHALVH